MERLVLVASLTVLFNFSLRAQEKFFRGQITNDSLPSPVHIINISSEKGTLSEETGAFALTAEPGDSIVFSSVQYKNVSLVIKSEMLDEVFEIALENELHELMEVQVHKLSGNLKRDIKNLKTFDRKDFGIPYSSKKPPDIVARKIMGLSSPSDPVGLIYGALSGEKRKLKQARENQKKVKQILDARKLFSEEFYQNELGLEETEVMNFLYYCAENPGFLKLFNRKDLLGLIEFYNTIISQYKNHVSLD
ncbi:hypothetical protein [Salegentibacter sp. F14]